MIRAMDLEDRHQYANRKLTRPVVSSHCDEEVENDFALVLASQEQHR